MTDNDKLLAYVKGDLEDVDEVYALFQDLVNTGMAWKLEGSIGRTAMNLIEAGQIMLGEEGHRDYYGNYVPSRYEVKPGTKGSPEYVKERRADAGPRCDDPGAHGPGCQCDGGEPVL